MSSRNNYVSLYDRKIIIVTIIASVFMSQLSNYIIKDLYTNYLILDSSNNFILLFHYFILIIVFTTITIFLLFRLFKLKI